MFKYRYRAFGLFIESEIELTELIQSKSDITDVTISLGKVPQNISIPVSKGLLWEASKSEFLLNIDGVSRYYVKNGTSIIIQHNPDAEWSEIRHYLLGSCMGAVLHLKGILPLHGSAIVANDFGVIFTGASSAGKSSTIAGFVKKGYHFISDDISALVLRSENQFWIQPSIPNIKLWKDVIDHLDNSVNLERIKTNIEKYKSIVTENFYPKEIKIKYIIHIVKRNSKGFTMNEAKGIEKFTILRENTYRPQFIYGLGQTENHYNQLSTLSNSVRLITIERPSYPLLIEELVEFIENNILYPN